MPSRCSLVVTGKKVWCTWKRPGAIPWSCTTLCPTKGAIALGDSAGKELLTRSSALAVPARIDLRQWE
jgi:hypothetical protein